ncbi:MAG: barstar family protein [Planctomycetes bacterium]|nr:barstar family protein [Planctomycetota bacterium]
MREIQLVASGLRSADDVYDALFRALGSPAWHGRNHDALRDSLVVGRINDVEPPFRLVIVGASAAGDEARAELRRLATFLHGLRGELRTRRRSIE